VSNYQSSNDKLSGGDIIGNYKRPRDINTPLPTLVDVSIPLFVHITPHHYEDQFIDDHRLDASGEACSNISSHSFQANFTARSMPNCAFAVLLYGGGAPDSRSKLDKQYASIH
jgi:hypothetical protein